MKTSILSSAKRILFFVSFIAFTALIYGFGPAMDEQEWLSWSNKCLSETFNPAPDVNLKKWEITLTSDYFLRLRKTYQHGKQEYYSFNMHRLNNIEYLGSDTTGTLKLSTITDDIIVQTYEDPEGNIDSMATTLSIPVKNMPEGRLDSLKNALNLFKQKSL